MARPKGIPAWNKGKTNKELYGEEKATELSRIAAENASRTKNRTGTSTSDEGRKNMSASHKGKASHRKGISNVEEYGQEKAKEIKQKKSGAALEYFEENSRNYPQRKGKTWIEVIGEEKAEKANRKRSEALLGKAHLEILGSEEKVIERNTKHAISMRETWREHWQENPPEDRNSTLYDIWRTACKTRDSFTCQHCGIKEADLPKTGLQVEDTLHVHHIKSWSEFPLLRYEVDNGLTLCVNCHRKEETRLANIRTLEDKLACKV